MDASVLFSQNELILSITAIKTDGSMRAVTVLVLRFPKITSTIEFKKQHYTANYSIPSGSDAALVSLDDAIIIKGANTNEITFSIEGIK